MILTIQEAERILCKIFEGTARDVKIGADGGNPPSLDLYMPEIVAGVAHIKGKIHAIKMYRYIRPGTGLADAKHYVEDVMARHGITSTP